MQLIKTISVLFFFSFLTSSLFSQSQVLGVQYYMKYDTATCWYDCHVIISEGSATAIPFRTQFNSQYTLVVPTGAIVTIEETYLPLKDNQYYQGTEPAGWNIGASAFNVMDTGVDYHPIAPNLSIASQYNDIMEGDTLKIFSFSVDNNSACGKGVRFFENGVDPNVNGGDFSCGFTIGGPFEDFQGLSPVVYPPKLDIPMPTVDTQNGITIDLDMISNECQETISYSWTGPNNYFSSLEDVIINPASPSDYGTYTIIVEDNIECKDTLDVIVDDPMGAAMDEAILENVKFYSTFENISIHANITGDDNKNSTFSIEYKLSGTDSYLPGALSMRASPDMNVNGSALGMNFHAGSAMNLLPNSSYDIKIIFTDSDGGSETVEQTISTKKFPQSESNGSIVYVIPGNGGGDGSQANPYQGLQTAVNNVAPGDILEVADGNYDSFALTTSGSSDMPITIRSANLHGAIINGANTSAGVVTIGTASDSIGHIILDGFEIKNGAWGIDAQNTQYLTIKNNKINDVDFGFYNRRENGWEHNQYLTNNEIIGRTSWPQLNGNIPGERGVDIRGNNNVISYNSISDFGDGVSTDGPADQNSYGLDIHNNYITRVVDDIIEVDGTISNIRVYENQGLNGRSGVSVAPIYGGPVYIFRNQFYNLENSAFKMNNQTAGLVILNNSIAKEGRGMTSPAGWQNTIFKNNVVLSSHYVFEEFGLVVGSEDAWGHNAYLSLRAGNSSEPWFKWNNVQYSTVPDIVSGGMTESSSITASYVDFMNVIIPNDYGVEALPSGFDFTLTPTSILTDSGHTFDNINVGSVSDGQVDIGALEAGEQIPQYGAGFTNDCERIDLTTRVWNGSMNKGWHHPYNWTPCGVPTNVTDVSIPTDLDNYPLLNSDATAKNISILGTGILDITHEATLTLEGNP